MPSVADVAGCKDFLTAGESHATGGRRHDLVGANIGTMRVMQALYGGSGTLEVDDLFYDQSMDRTQRLLESAATLDVTFPDGVDLGEGMELQVRVTNESGHKLPTGYFEGRVMWLEVEATYLGSGEVVYSSGVWDPEARVIEDDDQVRRYEAIAEDAHDGTQLHLLRNNRWVVDNRIPPRGLTADVETDPVSDRYAMSDGAWLHFDDVTYTFAAADVDDVDDLDDELQIHVRLLYLVNTPEYLDVLADDNQTNNAGTMVAAAFSVEEINPPMVLAQAERTVALGGLVVPAGTSAATASDSHEASAERDDEGVNGGCSGCRVSSQNAWHSVGLGLLCLGRRRRASSAPART